MPTVCVSTRGERRGFTENEELMGNSRLLQPIVKVSAQDKASGRKAHITIQNSVGRLSSAEIDQMIKDAEQ